MTLPALRPPEPEVIDAAWRPLPARVRARESYWLLAALSVASLLLALIVAGWAIFVEGR